MIPLVDLPRQYCDLRDDLLPAMAGVMESGDFILGQELTEFEREFARYCGTDHCVGVGSGLDALHLSLRAMGIGPGDEVITAANTFVATALAILHAGATPVLVDVLEDDFNLDPDLVEAAVTPRTRAIIPVHLYGHPARMREILDIAARHHLRVLEDACQAHGALVGDARVGSLGDAGCFSFYPGKNLGAFGDGGAVVTSDAGLAERLRRLRHYGQRVKYHHETVGFNSRLDTLQAAVLRVKLRHLDGWNARRVAHAAAYSALLAHSGLRLPAVRPGVDHVYHLYVVRTPDRAALGEWLAEHGVASGVHYPRPLHLQPSLAGVRTVPEGVPVTTRLSREILSLPLFPEMAPAELLQVAEVACVPVSSRSSLPVLL